MARLRPVRTTTACWRSARCSATCTSTDGWARRAWTWHEAADTRVFRPLAGRHREGDLVWVGNWGDDERTAELHEFLLDPVQALGLKARVYGVRYPDHARAALADAGIEYAGWLPNFERPRSSPASR